MIAQILGGKALPWAAGAALLVIVGLGGLLRIEQLQRRAAEDATREAQQQLLDAQAQVAQRNSQIKALERQAAETAATAARIEPIRREVHAAPRTSACLASRIAYGIPLTEKALKQVELGEEILRSFCPENTQLRLRHHGFLARIEAPRELLPLLAEPERAEKIGEALAGLGFSFVTLDLAGYRMGSMNDLIGSGSPQET